jgi:hypothetical protein
MMINDKSFVLMKSQLNCIIHYSKKEPRGKGLVGILDSFIVLLSKNHKELRKLISILPIFFPRLHQLPELKFKMLKVLINGNILLIKKDFHKGLKLSRQWIT